MFGLKIPSEAVVKWSLKNSLFYKCRRTQGVEEFCLENREGCKSSRAFESFRRRQRASVRKFYMYYCSIIRLIGNVSIYMPKSKHLVVQFTENLKECEHNMAHWWRRVSRLPVTLEVTGSNPVFRSIQVICSWVNFFDGVCNRWSLVIWLIKGEVVHGFNSRANERSRNQYASQYMFNMQNSNAVRDLSVVK